MPTELHASNASAARPRLTLRKQARRIVTMKKLRIYVDTSVIGGCFDDRFRESSVRLFDEFRAGKKALIVSEVVADELEGAGPVEKVRPLTERAYNSRVGSLSGGLL